VARAPGNVPWGHHFAELMYRGHICAR